MKKLAWIMALLLCLCCTACDSSVETSPIEDTQESVETISQEEETAVPVVEEADAAVLDFQEIALSLNNAQSLDTTSLYFTEVLGVRKTWENSLPEIMEFSYPYVFYERMSSFTKEEIENLDQEYNSRALAVGRYSMETGETTELIIDDFYAMSEEARLIVDNDRIVYMYFSIDEDGLEVMKTILFDFSKQTITPISTNSAYNVFGYVKCLSENKIVCFMYESPNPTERRSSQQIIFTYDLQTDKLEELYRGEIMGGYTEGDVSTKDIFAIDTYDGNIYLLMQQYMEDRMHYYLCVLDATGATISDQELKALSDYNTLGDTAENIVVRDHFLFIHFYRYGDTVSDTPDSAFLQKTDSGYNLLDLQDTTPGSCIGKSEPYVYFRDSETDNTIYAVNSETGEAYAITLPWEEVTSVTVDASGNILVAVREDDVDHWVLIPAEDISF